MKNITKEFEIYDSFAFTVEDLNQRFLVKSGPHSTDSLFDIRVLEFTEDYEQVHIKQNTIKRWIENKFFLIKKLDSNMDVRTILIKSIEIKTKNNLMLIVNNPKKQGQYLEIEFSSSAVITTEIDKEWISDKYGDLIFDKLEYLDKV